MKRSIFVPFLFAGSALLLSGCASKLASPEQYSGFLKDYSGLKEAQTASGKPVMRWVAKDFHPEDYHSVIYQPVVYYPEPKPTTRIGKETLDKILSYTDIQMKDAVSQRYPLVDKPGKGTLVFRSAITAVDTSNQGLQFYEVLPITLALAGTEYVTGYRTQDTHLYFEGELMDSQTHKVVAKFVRKGQGKQISNANKLLTLNDMKGVVDNMAKDARNFEVAKRDASATVKGI